MSDTFAEIQQQFIVETAPRWQGTAYRGYATGREHTPRVRGQRTEGSVALAPISIDKLYYADEGSRPELIRALNLMADGIKALEQSKCTIQDGNLMLADQYLLGFQSLLPDLFKCRKIGDGFANIINAIHFAFVNRKGKPLSFEETNLVWRVMKELRNAPFLSFETSLEFVSQLKRKGLLVFPSVLADLVPDPEPDSADD
jgi:hypothetical protein